MAAIDLVMPVVTPLFACMKMDCPEAGDYEPMGVCNLMINIGLGAVAPMLPVIDLLTGLPDSLGDFPPDLIALPFAGLTVPPLPLPSPFPAIGSLDMPSWPGVDLPGLPPLLDLLFGIIKIPFDIIVDLVSFSPPELPLPDLVIGLVLGVMLALPGIEAPMLPTLGLLQLAICIIMLLLLPFVLLGLALKPFLDGLVEPAKAAVEATMAPIMFIMEIPKEVEELDVEAMVMAAYEKELETFETKKAAKRKAAQKDVVIEEDVETEWKPSIKDYYYG
jgi:hypothetical protein